MSLVHSFYYRCCRVLCTVVLKFLYHTTILHADRIPRAGGVLVISNHQSHLDPPAISTGFTRRSCAFLARESLFKHPLFGWLIRSLNSIPVKRDSSDTAGMKTALQTLKKGHALLVFPEGTRTPDGTIKPFKRGVALLIKRGGCPILPIAIEGAYDAWPKNDRPHLTRRRIAIVFGEPLDPKDLMRNGPDEALKRLARDIDTLRLEARAVLWNKTNGRYPPPGFADDPIDVSEWGERERESE